MGKGGLVTERSQRPALCGFNAHGIDLDSAEGIVDDLRVGRSRNRSIRANSDGQNGRNSDAHFGGCGVAADAAVSGGRECDTGCAGASRSVNGVGSGSADCKACHQADSENEGNDLLKVFHSKILLKIL